MFFEKFRKKAALNHLEKKGSDYSGFVINTLTNNFVFAKTSYVYLQYYSQVAPVGDSISKITNEACNIDLLPYVTEENEAFKPLIEDDFVKKFRKPNFRQSGSDFRKEAFTHYLATGNNYVFLSGVLNSAKDKVMSDPLEIYNYRPDLVTPYAYDEGYPEKYTYSYNGLQKVFERKLIKDRNNKLLEAYVEKDGFGVLVHLKEPSTNDSFTMMIGDSPLQSVELEINQYLQASIHNANLLNNGLSARMLFSPKDGNTPPNLEQLKKVREYLAREYSGVNGNKNLVLGLPFDVKPLDMNLKDMDFEKLMRRMRVAIYNKLNIPLPLVEGEFTSNTNMKEANLNFYDKAILPLVDKYCESYFLFIYNPFFKSNGAFKIGYEEAAIPALRSRLFENSLLMKKAGTVTINELREYQGLGRVNQGGDTIYIDANQVAVAGDENFTDTIGIPARGQDIEDDVDEDMEDDMDEVDDELEEEKALSDLNLKPTESMSSNAARGLEWRKKYNRGGTAVGVSRARDLVNRKDLSPSTVGRMVSYFARHEIDKQGKGWNAGEDGYPSAGKIAWLLWGGDSGKSWADKKWDQIKRERESRKELEHNSMKDFLAKQFDSKGDRLYSDEDIKRILDESKRT